MTLRLTPVVKSFLVIYVFSFIIQQSWDQFFGGEIQKLFGLVPLSISSGMIYQIFTYSFLHADVMHLFLNGLMLALIGSELEALWGWKKFLRFYFLCTITAGVFYLVFTFFLRRESLLTPMVGASGAIYGFLVAYGLLFAERTMLFMMVFPVKAKNFVLILGGLEFLTTVFTPGMALSSMAHLGGMFAAFFLIWLKAKWIARSGLKRISQNVRKSTKLRIVK